MPDITTREGREAERNRLGAEDGDTYEAICDGKFRFMCAAPRHRAHESLRSALDGLDIAQEMAEAVVAVLTPCPPENHLVDADGVCPECDVERQARAALAKWDKWLDTYSSPPPS